MGRLPAYMNSGLRAPQIMKLGRHKAAARHRLLTLHCRHAKLRIE